MRTFSSLVFLFLLVAMLGIGAPTEAQGRFDCSTSGFAELSPILRTVANQTERLQGVDGFALSGLQRQFNILTVVTEYSLAICAERFSPVDAGSFTSKIDLGEGIYRLRATGSVQMQGLTGCVVLAEDFTEGFSNAIVYVADDCVLSVQGVASASGDLYWSYLSTTVRND